MYIDAHMHINTTKGADSCAFLDIIYASMSTDFESNNLLVTHSNIHKFIGVHPLFYQDKDKTLLFIDSLFKQTDVNSYVGVGEIGFDKNCILNDKDAIEVFDYQLLKAIEHKKSVSLHLYKRHDLLLQRLKFYKDKLSSINLCLHNAILSEDLIKKYLDLDLYFSLGFYIQKGHSKLLKLLELSPQDRILLESDYDGDFSLYKAQSLKDSYKSLSLFYKIDEDSMQEIIEHNYFNFLKSK